MRTPACSLFLFVCVLGQAHTHTHTQMSVTNRVPHCVIYSIKFLFLVKPSTNVHRKFNRVHVPVSTSIRLRKWMALLNNKVWSWGTNAAALKTLIFLTNKCQCIHNSFTQIERSVYKALEESTHCLKQAGRDTDVLSAWHLKAQDTHTQADKQTDNHTHDDRTEAYVTVFLYIVLSSRSLDEIKIYFYYKMAFASDGLMLVFWGMWVFLVMMQI